MYPEEVATTTGATATARPLVHQEETHELDVVFTTLQEDPEIIGGAQLEMPAMGALGATILMRAQIMGHVVDLEEGPWLVLNHVLPLEECALNQGADLPGEVYAQNLA